MNHRYLLLAGALAAATQLSCRSAMIALSQLKPQPTKKVAAEFSRLPGHKVVVLAWVEPGALLDYPYARYDAANHIRAHLAPHLEETDFVDPARVEDYLESSYSAATDPVAVGKKFKADFVVYAELTRFSVRDPSAPQLYRGRIESSVVVYDLTVDEGEPNRFELTPVKVVVPEEGPIAVNQTHPTEVRRATCEELGAAVAQRFYEHEAEL